MSLSFPVPNPQKKPNPRRTPSHLSVSLVHGRKPTGPQVQTACPHTIKPNPQITSSSSALNEKNDGSTNDDDKGVRDGLRPKYERNHSSGESSNVDNWFESSNNNVQAVNPAIMDGKLPSSINTRSVQDGLTLCSEVDEPPFYLRNSSSSSNPPEADRHHHQLLKQTRHEQYQQYLLCQQKRQHQLQQQQQQSYFNNHSPKNSTTNPFAYRNGPAQDFSDDSSSEDFRGVIDDLTIENQKLKRKLKKYQSLHDSHLQADKLFEVRVHGLSVGKKRELEEMMKKFALSLAPPSPDAAASLTQTAIDSSAQAYARNYKLSHPASSATSRFADSAYASLSGSGQSGIASASKRPSDRPPHKSTITNTAVNNNIINNINLQSHLQEVPAALLPKEKVPMSDRAQKRMVVRRLEQVFAGKSRADGGHQQPEQQEEVAQSAASAERRARQESGRKIQAEGLREARIMPVREATRGDDFSDGGQRLQQNFDYGSEGAAEKAQKRDPELEGSSPDQRPTRPLDLDPNRAQYRDENIGYLRHLGFLPSSIDSNGPPEQDHGWIYLNLLMNMAQLHTANVTLEFVKKAITSFDTKLELSQDGRKVRWKGGCDIANSNSNQSTPLHGTSNSSSPSTKAESSASVNGSKRHKRVHKSGGDDDIGRRTDTAKFKNVNFGCAKHPAWYSPVLYRHERSDESDQSDGCPKTPSEEAFLPVGNLLQAVSEPALKSTSSGRRDNDGPIIFYSKARFCTDLSGDSNGRQVVPCNDSAITSVAYKATLDRPLGDVLIPATSDDGSDDGLDTTKLGVNRKGPLSINNSAQLLDAMQLDHHGKHDSKVDVDDGRANPPSSEMDIEFSPDGVRFCQECNTVCTEEKKEEDNNATAMDIDPDSLNAQAGKGDDEFVVSGLGGVQPSDNFAVDVVSQLVRTSVGPDGGDEKEEAAVHRSYNQTASWKRYHPRIQEALRKGEVSVPATTGVADFAMPDASSKAGALMYNYAPHSHRSQPLIKEVIVSARRRDLPISVLPSPNFLPHLSMSDGTVGLEDEDSSSEEEDEEINVDVKSPSYGGNFLANNRGDAMSISLSSREQEQGEDFRSDMRMSGRSTADYDDDDDDNDDDDEGPKHLYAAKGLAIGKSKLYSAKGGASNAATASYEPDSDNLSSRPSSMTSSVAATSDSVDFLAEARELDPEFVREREREYAADMAERLAEEIPAGSSAATAGGGSGYNSPGNEKKRKLTKSTSSSSGESSVSDD